ncbi:ABC transporter permease [Ilumatobacter nonamiensis]|uniref:ABC transporter permease n=1 Tax=Ilumatobacter nonamiensis TaxID=467093 RepID=UPI0005903D16|nr:ABC transporter permease [Ilumatobacter nonamiensis]
MTQLIVKRLLSGLLALFLIATFLFFVMRSVPGDAIDIQLAESGLSEERITEVKDEMGLNDPILEQYADWASGIVRLDFGDSLVRDESVLDIILRRLPVTLELSFLAIALSLAFGPIVGMLSAIRRGKPSDAILRVGSIVGLSIPNFLVGVLMITYLSEWFGYSVPIGYQEFWESPWVNLQQMILPAIALALSVGAATARMTRSSMLEVLGTDYIRTVRAKGADERMINTRHAFKNSLIPVLTLVGLQFGGLLGGTVILEAMFSLPGLGSQVFEAVRTRDYPLIQAAALVYGAMFILVNIMVDLAYGWIDPRIRAS